VFVEHDRRRISSEIGDRGEIVLKTDFTEIVYEDVDWLHLAQNRD